MPQFKWIEWNLDKIAGHGLSFEEVEYAFETIGVMPSGRTVLIVWRYDEEIDTIEDDGTIEVVFVITTF